MSLALSIWIFKDRFGLVATVIGFPILSISLALIVASASSTSSILAKTKVPGAYVIATVLYLSVERPFLKFRGEFLNRKNTRHYANAEVSHSNN